MKECLKLKMIVPGAGDENIVIFARRHWASMLGPIGLTILMILFPMALFVILYSSNMVSSGLWLSIITVFASIYFLVLLTFIFIEWVDYYYDIFLLTDDEIVDINQQGIFNRQISQIALVNIQDVSASVKGFIPTLFNYGNIVAESAGEQTRTYILDSIPNPMIIADRILEIHNQAKSRWAAKHQNISGQELVRMDVQRPNEPPCPPCPPVSTPTPPPSSNNIPPQSAPTAQSQPYSEPQGEIQQNDLNQGGEVKFN